MSTKANTAIEFKSAEDPVVDAFTGGPLTGETTRCAKCFCCYGPESTQALLDHNNGMCIGCNEPIDGMAKN